MVPPLVMAVSRAPGPGPQPLVDGVVVQVRGAPAARGVVAVGQRVHDRVEGGPGELPVGPGAAHEGVEVVGAPLGHRDLGHDLLGQRVQRRRPAAGSRPAPPGARRRAAPRIPPGRPGTRGTAGPWAARSTPWPERPTRCSSVAMLFGDAIWQTRSTSPMSMPSSSDAVATSTCSLPGLQALLRVEPVLPGEAAVMGRDRVLAQPLGQVPRGPLREPAGVDEDQRGAVLPHQFGEPVVDLGPHLVGHDGRERRRGQFDARDPAAA